MRGAHADRASYYSKALGSGGSPAWMTQDEIRGLEELNSMGGDAAVLPELPGAADPVADSAEVPAEDPAAKAAADIVEIKAALAAVRDLLRHAPAPVQQQPNIDIKAGDVHVTLPELRITNAQAAQDAPNVEVNVAAAEQPEIHFTAPDVRVEVAAPTVNVESKIVQPADMTMHIVSMPTRETLSDVTRDASGRIVSTVQVERDV